MKFWDWILVSSLGTLFGGFLLALIFPAVKSLFGRIWARIANRPLIKPKLMAELKILEDSSRQLLRINSISRFPDALKTKDVLDILVNIGEKAQKLEYWEFEEIRSQLIAFSAHASSLNPKINPMAIVIMLGEETAYDLADKIKKKIAEIIKAKKRKKKGIKGKAR